MTRCVNCAESFAQSSGAESLTAAGNIWNLPAAQLGSQALTLAVPEPSAVLSP
jgi:hypothetical protein